MSDDDQGHRIERLEAENVRLRRLLDQQGMPRHLRHQTRNALGLMRAVLRRSAEGKTDVQDYMAHVEGRFDAMLRVQTALLSSPDGCIDLASLIANELLAQTIKEGKRALLAGPPLRLEARQAELLGLVLHELATNAIKFGAMTTPTGQIDVTWKLDSSAQRLVLAWAENGRAPSGAPSSFRGFGTEAIEGMLPYQLKAESTLEFLSEGLRCTIVLPLSSLER